MARYVVYMSDTDDRWFELMLSLYEHRDLLVSSFLEEVGEVFAYQKTEVTFSDLQETAYNAFVAMLHYIINDPKDVDPRMPLARQLGQKRAQQHIPIETLEASISLDFKIMWNVLTHLAFPEDAPVLAENVESLWETVNGFRQATQAEYHAECLREESYQIEERALDLEKFIHSHDSTSQAATIVSRSLSIPYGQQYCVCYGNTVPAFRASLRLIRSYSKRVVLYQGNAEAFALFWPTDVPMGSGHPLQALRSTPCGYLAAVENLAAVPRALRIVRKYMLTIDQRHLSGPIDIEQHWVGYAQAELFSFLPELAERYDRQISALDAEHANDTVMTVAKYVQTGSIQLTTMACSCHRNTVMKRIKSFETVTGLNLKNPTDLAFTVLLMEHLSTNSSSAPI
jgi:hypothetical protein